MVAEQQTLQGQQPAPLPEKTQHSLRGHTSIKVISWQGGGVGRGNASNGGGGNAGTASGEQTAAAIQDTAQGNAGSSRGLDSGLAKAAPKAEGLTQKGYRSYRRRLELFAMQCKRRGRDAEIEGAFLVVSLWKDVVWEAAEQLDLTDIELDENPFNPTFLSCWIKYSSERT